MKALVYIDQFAGTALPSTWETIGAARSLGDVSVEAALVGADLSAAAAEAFGYGAEKVYTVEGASYKEYDAAIYTSALAKAVEASGAEAVILPTTTRGNELAAMLAVDLESGVLVDVIDLSQADGTIQATRPIYAGKALSKVQCDASPVIITIRNRAFSKPEFDPGKTGSAEVLSAAGTASMTTTGYDQAEGGVSLTDASVIVSGGRGAVNTSAEPPADLDDAGKEHWKAQQGFALIRELAETLNGAVGASRAVVDADYIAYEHQVGQTGKIVAPDLYIAAGISGAIQHMAGMRNSKLIVAINKDAEAPIFKYARFGVAQDMHTFLPVLTEAFKAKLAG